ncbi:hypothetical protein CsSME_00053476 [Camellia sinensis var. sinensis]
MEVLAVVQGFLAECAKIDQIEVAVELLAVKTELETTHRGAVSLEFELASEQKKGDEAQEACAIANERLEEALVNNKELREASLEEKEEADTREAEWAKALEEENAKLVELEKMRRQRGLFTQTCARQQWNSSSYRLSFKWRST